LKTQLAADAADTADTNTHKRTDRIAEDMVGFVCSAASIPSTTPRFPGHSSVGSSEGGTA
jgi:hypothetical protein